MDKHLTEVCKLLFLAVTLLFAPIWIPIALVIISTTTVVVGGIVVALAMVTFTVLSFFLGVVGIPALLFSTAVTAFAYIASKIFEKVADKIPRVIKPFIEVNMVKEFLGWFPFMKRFGENKEIIEGANSEVKMVKKNDSWGNIPRYEEESEVETEASHQNFENRPFPFPRASLGFIDATDNLNEVEDFFNNIEEIYSVISSLRKLSRIRNKSRMSSTSRMRSASRRNTIA